MKILMIYPEFPVTYWSFKHVLKIISKKATEPPLGLITVSSMLPEKWERKLIDMNIKKLKDKDIKWADMVFIGCMSIQKESFKKAVKRCNDLGVKVVAGGPMVTERVEDYSGIDHFILNEAEITLPPFLEDLSKGEAKKIYSTKDFADIDTTPIPDWSLLEMKHYVLMDLQYSRGCPFNCEFCSITALLGRKPRMKSAARFISELDSLHDAGWRGDVFVVDDNFIGNKHILKKEMLPALTAWQETHFYPFNLTSEVSINLADDEELMNGMSAAGFSGCFVGIETPEDGSLDECGKSQNRGRDMIESVKILQRKGFKVSGGFIVGFDSDNKGTFEKQFNFIQQSGIVSAMVGLLNAPYGTLLYKRLESENRIIKGFSGDNTDGSLNFVSKMDPAFLRNGYRKLIRKIYSPQKYFERIKTFLSEYEIPNIKLQRESKSDLKTVLKVVFRLGFFQSRGKLYFWKLLSHTIRNYPEKLAVAMTMAVYGLHFRKIADSV